MAASGRSSGGDDDDEVLLHPPPPPSPCSSQPTCWELLSTDSKTPNPRPTKTMRMEESSDPPLQPSYEVVFSVDLDIPPPLVDEEESSEEKPKGEGRAESVRIEYDTDDDMEKEKEEEEEEEDWCALVDIPSPEVKKCNICRGDHYTCNCSYLSRIPYGMKVPNDKDYVILCECGRMCVDGGKCGDSCCLMRDRSVAPRGNIRFVDKGCT